MSKVDYKKSFFFRCLEPPDYGYERGGQFYFPTAYELFKEFFKRSNVFADRRNWMSAWHLFALMFLPVMIYFYVRYYFTWPSFIFLLVWTCVEGWLWEAIHHRGFTHGSYKINNKFLRILVKHIHTSFYPEEIYEFSHICHHQFSDVLGDPYTPKGGLLYIMMTDVNHQLINRNLSESDFNRIRNKLSEYVLFLNSYKQYKKWGTICHPFYYITCTALILFVKMSFIAIFFGPEFAYAFYLAKAAMNMVAKFVNYFLHGYGKDMRREGHEFNKDLAYNSWLGIIGVGQWHANHHLYPNSINTGFHWYQIDPPYLFIKALYYLGIATELTDNTADYFKDHYKPYLSEKLAHH